jgi:hypothetical protein
MVAGLTGLPVEVDRMSEPLDSQLRDAWRLAPERAGAVGRPVTPGDYLLVEDPPHAAPHPQAVPQGLQADRQRP